MSTEMKRVTRSILILGIVGTLVSAQQVRAESVFTGRGPGNIEKLTLQPLVIAGASSPASGSCALSFLSLRGDTIEMFDVPIEEEKGPGMVKQLVVFAIITAAVGYAVIVLMQSDSEPEETKTPEKPIPEYSRSLGTAMPFSRSR